MSTFIHQPQIELESHRCYECGRYYATEIKFWPGNIACPFCSGGKIDEANAKADAAERSKRSLQGALTKLKAHDNL